MHKFLSLEKSQLKKYKMSGKSILDRIEKGSSANDEGPFVMKEIKDIKKDIK